MPLRRFLFIRTRNKSSISARTRAKLLSAGRRAAIRLVAFIRRPARGRGQKVYHPQTKFISVGRAPRIKRCNNGARPAPGTRRKSRPRGDRRQRGPRPAFGHPSPTEDLIARSITLHPYGASFSSAAYPSCTGRRSRRGPQFDCSWKMAEWGFYCDDRFPSNLLGGYLVTAGFVSQVTRLSDFGLASVKIVSLVWLVPRGSPVFLWVSESLEWSPSISHLPNDSLESCACFRYGTETLGINAFAVTVC